MANLLQDFLCMDYSFKNSLYIKKSVDEKKISNLFLYTPLLRIYSCYCHILWILYEKKKKKPQKKLLSILNG